MAYSRPVTKDMYSTSRRQANEVKDKKVYGKTADQTHKINIQVKPMRGGFRL